jgi:hypothetical protein
MSLLSNSLGSLATLPNELIGAILSSAAFDYADITALLRVNGVIAGFTRQFITTIDMGCSFERVPFAELQNFQSLQRVYGTISVKDKDLERLLSMELLHFTVEVDNDFPISFAEWLVAHPEQEMAEIICYGGQVSYGQRGLMVQFDYDAVFPMEPLSEELMKLPVEQLYIPAEVGTGELYERIAAQVPIKVLEYGDPDVAENSSVYGPNNHKYAKDLATINAREFDSIEEMRYNGPLVVDGHWYREDPYSGLRLTKLREWNVPALLRQVPALIERFPSLRRMEVLCGFGEPPKHRIRKPSAIFREELRLTEGLRAEERQQLRELQEQYPHVELVPINFQIN